VDELTGRPGELIDRLLAAVDLPDTRDRREVTVVLVSAVVSVQRRDGGALEVGDMVEVNELSQRDDLSDELRGRMVALVASGRREEDVVRTLRDRITSHCEDFGWADESETTPIEATWTASVEEHVSDRVIDAWAEHRDSSSTEGG
jgi:hypothetical protein